MKHISDTTRAHLFNVVKNNSFIILGNYFKHGEKKRKGLIDLRIDKKSLLHTAAFFGSMDCMQILVEYTTNLDIRDDDGNTPLLEAIRQGHNDIAQLLLNHGAQDLPNYAGLTAQSAAYARLTPEKMQKMLAKIVELLKDPNITWEDEAAQLELYSYLIARTNEFPVLAQGQTILHDVAILGCVQRMKLILSLLNDGQKKQFINMVDPKGRTPLHNAAACGHLNAAKFLVDEGANIAAVDRAGCTPLLLAEQAEKWDVAELLERAVNNILELGISRATTMSPLEEQLAQNLSDSVVNLDRPAPLVDYYMSIRNTTNLAELRSIPQSSDLSKMRPN